MRVVFTPQAFMSNNTVYAMTFAAHDAPLRVVRDELEHAGARRDEAQYMSAMRDVRTGLSLRRRP